MFEDLELPDMERKILKEALSERVAKRLGYRKQGVRAHLDRKRTAKQRIKRQIARGVTPASKLDQEAAFGPPERFPFNKADLTYRRLRVDTREESNAVVICIMDTSGSMDRLKKYLARSFFFLLFQFVCTKYQNTELVFVGHHTQAKEVTEDEFFHKGESGGTLISSGYKKALEIIQNRYHPTHWNIYAFHCSDGDNFDSDNAEAMKAARELCDTCNLFGYGEIKPMGSHYYESSMIERFKKLAADNFQSVLIERREDIWPAFKAFMSKDRVQDAGDGHGNGNPGPREGRRSLRERFLRLGARAGSTAPRHPGKPAEPASRLRAPDRGGRGFGKKRSAHRPKPAPPPGRASVEARALAGRPPPPAVVEGCRQCPKRDR
jgi:uncharacterized protein